MFAFCSFLEKRTPAIEFFVEGFGVGIEEIADGLDDQTFKVFETLKVLFFKDLIS